jgi:autotransporter-associated beta strand protein
VPNISINSSSTLKYSSSTGQILGGIISGTGALIKDTSATSTLTLTNANTYTGSTTVNAGKLIIDGSTAAGSAVAVGASGTLGGTGTINGTLAVTGILSPGTGPGDIQTLDAGTTTWNGGSVWNFDLSSSGNTSDKLKIAGNLVKGTGSGFAFDFMGSTPFWNTTYTLAEWSGSLSGFVLSDFDAVASRNTLGAGSYSTSYFTITGNTLTFTAIPEPSTALAGLLLAAGLLRRRRAFER